MPEEVFTFLWFTLTMYLPSYNLLERIVSSLPPTAMPLFRESTALPP